MTCNKRKGVDGEPDGNETGKKTKREEDEPGLPEIQSKAGMIQGPDDASITSLFTTLFYTINTFVHEYFKGAPYSMARKNDQKVFFESLTGSDSTAYLKSKQPGAKEAIITAAIWNELIRPLLSAPITAFNETIPEHAIKNHTSGAVEEFYAWRTLTAHFLASHYKGPISWGEGGERREQFVEEMASLLLDHSVIKRQNELESGLDGIADKAFHLATAMACSRAYWVCTTRDPRIGKLHGFKIKTDRMDDVDLWDEDEGHGKGTTVDLVKTPMLLKYGNSDGQNYDQCRVVRKAEVVVKAKKAHD
ncbi:hypothetical protein INS49_004329 [Diaporthe citri]|uniref:uncharacterized protein n=1 Tax=Diaporthe citri TaxID=83186 RepID=UPI001C819BB8|nr:uncharacterized protein INS49_004329 [Diaporthe citri]KAG6355247.1 hypothetical protein INS49_004329 [Diaporthe citri]